jgi:hypothetical protein
MAVSQFAVAAVSDRRNRLIKSRRSETAATTSPIHIYAADEPLANLKEIEMSLTKTPTMTQKRITASRVNGRRSRGARTREGRARAAAANLRHGFYSEAQGDVLVALGEDPERFESLVDSLTETWQPANEMEMRLVMRMVRALWRMERADRIQESLTVEQFQRSMPKPTFVQMVNRALKDKANKVTSLATEVCQPGHFTRPEDLDLFEEVYGDGPQEPGSEEHSILASLWRLMEPGTEGAGPVIDGSDPKAEGTLPEDEELRKKERQNLMVMLIKQLAQIDTKSVDGDVESEEPSPSRYGWDAMMAPQDRNGPIMLMQRWEDSNMRKVLQITELLTKMKNGKLGPARDEI